MKLLPVSLAPKYFNSATHSEDLLLSLCSDFLPTVYQPYNLNCYCYIWHAPFLTVWCSGATFFMLAILSAPLVTVVTPFSAFICVLLLDLAAFFFLFFWDCCCCCCSFFCACSANSITTRYYATVNYQNCSQIPIYPTLGLLNSLPEKLKFWSIYFYHFIQSHFMSGKWLFYSLVPESTNMVNGQLNSSF